MSHSHIEKQLWVWQYRFSLFLLVSVSDIKKIFSYHVLWLYQLDCLLFLLDGLVGTPGKEVIVVQNKSPALCFALWKIISNQSPSILCWVLLYFGSCNHGWSKSVLTKRKVVQRAVAGLTTGLDNSCNIRTISKCLSIPYASIWKSNLSPDTWENQWKLVFPQSCLVFCKLVRNSRTPENISSLQDTFFWFSFKTLLGWRDHWYYWRNHGIDYSSCWHIHSWPYNQCYCSTQRSGGHGCIQFCWKQHIWHHSGVSSAPSKLCLF